MLSFHRVLGLLGEAVQEDCFALSVSLDCWTLKMKMKTPRLFEASVTVYQSTWRNMPEYLNSIRYCFFSILNLLSIFRWLVTYRYGCAEECGFVAFSYWNMSDFPLGDLSSFRTAGLLIYLLTSSFLLLYFIFSFIYLRCFICFFSPLFATLFFFSLYFFRLDA
jgi:hypothetical protein